MQFTPQQLSGGARFSNQTRIGNWYEEIALDESKLKAFQKRATQGSSSLRKQQIKLTLCNELVPHTYNEDGFVRFGDYVILQHINSSGVLACDPTEEIIPGQSKFVVTVFQGAPIPRARNTFRILRPPASLRNLEDDENDPIVRVGQPFLLSCNESLLVTPGEDILAPTLYLSSTRKTERTGTKRSNHQMVYLAGSCDAEAVWIAGKQSHGRIHSSDRLLSQGLPLPAFESFVISHRQTNMFLTCDSSQSFKSEFGVEAEAYANRSSGNGKLALLVSEFKGASTTQTLSKSDPPMYLWCFVGGSNERAGLETRQLAKPANLDILLGELRQHIVSNHGVGGFWDLRTYFQELDQKTSADGKLDRNDLKDAMVNWGCPFNARYLDGLIDCIDGRRLGLVDWRDFVVLLRGALPERRQDLLIELFSQMDSRGDGMINARELANYFNASTHPLVCSGELAEGAAFNHFLRCAASSSALASTASTASLKPSASGSSLPRSPSSRNRLPSAVTFEMFCNYYADLSGAIDNDAEFERMVTKGWNLGK